MGGRASPEPVRYKPNRARPSPMPTESTANRYARRIDGESPRGNAGRRPQPGRSRTFGPGRAGRRALPGAAAACQRARITTGIVPMDLFSQIAGSEHEQVLFGCDTASGLRAIHSTQLGPALGGTRFCPCADEGDALADALRLSRAMTAKDVGTSTADIDLMRRDTPHVVGLSIALGGSGDPSPAATRPRATFSLAAPSAVCSTWCRPGSCAVAPWSALPTTN